MKLLDQPRLAQPRLTNDQHQLAVALPCPLPAPHQHGDLLVATDERREMALPCAASTAAGANDPEQRHRLRHAFELMAAALLGDKQTCDLALHPRRDRDRTRFGQGLGTGRDVRHVAEYLACRHRPPPVQRRWRCARQAQACQFPRFCGSVQSATAVWRVPLARPARHRSPAPPDSRTAPSARRRASWRPCRPSPSPPPKRHRDRRQPDRAIPPHQVARQCRSKSTRSQNITVTCRRSPTVTSGRHSGWPSPPHGLAWLWRQRRRRQ